MTPLRRIRQRWRSITRRRSREMTWPDLLVLTGIFFGPAIVVSTRSALGAAAHHGEVGEAGAIDPQEFTSTENWEALRQQALQLACGAAYLCVRQVQLVPWTVRPTVRGTAMGLGLFAASAAACDGAFALVERWCGDNDAAIPNSGHPDEPGEDEPDAQGIQPDPSEEAQDGDLSLVLYSILNGFFEEFFFLVLCFSLRRRWQGTALAYSLLVRSAFHTYQGWFNTMLIGVGYGLGFAATSQAVPAQRIYPFVLAHALSDYFGMSLVDLFRRRA